MTDAKPLIVERVYDAPIQKVWQALTDKEQIKQWYFKLPEFKAEVGFEFNFIAGPHDGVQYKHLCKITEIIPERKISYTWIYDGYAGASLVSFALFEEADKTKLVLTHSGLETFDATNKNFDKTNFNEGWSYFVNSALNDFLSL